MIVCISGLSGCGKNAVGSLVAEKLGLRVVQFSFKDVAKEMGVSLMELQKLATDNEKFDKEMDGKIIAEANKGDCVVVTWLGSWMVTHPNVRVWLDASEGVRAKRISKRDSMAEAEALAHLRARDSNNRERYLRYYGIDIFDHSAFDLRINTDALTPEEIAERIVKEARGNANAKTTKKGDMMVAIAPGRVCIKKTGRDAGKTCVVVGTVDSNTVEIVCQGRKNKRSCAVRHLEPTARAVEAGDAAAVKKALE